MVQAGIWGEWVPWQMFNSCFPGLMSLRMGREHAVRQFFLHMGKIDVNNLNRTEGAQQ